MLNRPYVGAAIAAALAFLPPAPARAAGEILITHAKALAGNVTPGDTAGYPVTISIPGKFQLASNLFVAANKIGIQVTSPYVTIDLNGFLMQGSGVAWYGITGGQHSLIIQNGIIARFKFDGINGTHHRWTVDRVQVVDNGRHGIALESPGVGHHIRGTTVGGNGGTGIRCIGGSCVISENIVGSNFGGGIAANGATVIGNYIVLNSGFGLTATVVTVPIGFAHNVLRENGGTQVDGAYPLDPNLCSPACP